MKNLPVAKSSQWTHEQIATFLESTSVPMRLACHDASGFPLACSLWFCFQDNSLWCASHEKSHIVKLIQNNNKVGFEIGVNEPPYRGVRGQGEVTLVRERAADILLSMLHRYKINQTSGLAKWLLGRVEGEYALRIDIKRITAWDYTERMQTGKQDQQA